ncbi:hypothetical protein BDN71DRAFT_1458100 [Pleurotus eryngii]|uniref:Uncharacterized protein n=1 Tax=Pleurotus eryngii TaxID=5323 RepID=A0A9P5ZJJ6_PLEER|nr:hypothetical protein BDN71DRAFT_1458100 [Pleurotus eryngii]
MAMCSLDATCVLWECLHRITWCSVAHGAVHVHEHLSQLWVPLFHLTTPGYFIPRIGIYVDTGIAECRCLVAWMQNPDIVGFMISLSYGGSDFDFTTSVSLGDKQDRAGCVGCDWESRNHIYLAKKWPSIQTLDTRPAI